MENGRTANAARHQPSSIMRLSSDFFPLYPPLNTPRPLR